MPPFGQTPPRTFQQLRAEFAGASHQHPGVKHFWVQAAGHADQAVLETLAQWPGQPLEEVTQWPSPDGRVEYSCFLGSRKQLGHFKGLAERARSTFVKVIAQLGRKAPHGAFEGHVAWVADLYLAAHKDPTPLLAVQSMAMGEWRCAAGIKRVPIAWDGETIKHLEKLRESFGKPMAVHRYQSLLCDVCTASTAMIDKILEDPEVPSAWKASAASAGPTDLPAQGPAAPTGTSGGPVGSKPARPGWVNQAEMVGPCGHTEFATLMGISFKHLYRLIAADEVWKEKGPTDKKFYFHHRDPAAHRKLREEFERSKQKKR
jgi:hypothetical protein